MTVHYFPLTSVLDALGFEVLKLHAGVYHIRRPREEGPPFFEGVGLFFSPKPVAETDTIYFFSFSGVEPNTGAWPPGKSIADLLQLWGILDARRLGESGLEYLKLKRDQKAFGDPVMDNLVVKRPPPDSFRERVHALMSSGDVICYN